MNRTATMHVGPHAAEGLKIELGSAVLGEEQQSLDVRGRDMISGLPRRSVVSSQEIREALREPISQILDAVTHTLERCEPELAADLVDNGVHLCVCGAFLSGLDALMADATGLNVTIVDAPLSCVALCTSDYPEHLP